MERPSRPGRPRRSPRTWRRSGGIATASTLPLAGSWDAFLASPTRPDSGPATLSTCKTHWAAFLRWVGQRHPRAKRLADVTAPMAEGFFESLAASGVTGRSFNAKRQAVRLVYRQLAQREGLDTGITDRVQRKKSRPVSRRELSPERFMDLLDVFDRPDFHVMRKEETRVLVHLGAYTGMRLGDCATPRWEGIDTALTQIAVSAKKTGAPLILPIHPILAMRLRAAAAWRDDSGFVLPHVAERCARNPDGIIRDCQKVFARIGLDVTAASAQGRAKRAAQYGFHSLRHTFVSICAASGVPMALVQGIVGHASPAMTRHHTHLGVESLRAAVEAMPSPGAGGGAARTLPAPGADRTAGGLHAQLPGSLGAADGVDDGGLEERLRVAERRLHEALARLAKAAALAASAPAADIADGLRAELLAALGR